MNPQRAIYGSPILHELRVLKIIPISIRLRQGVQIYWKSIVGMRDLLLYILYVMVVVAVFCLEMFMGTLTQHCVKKQLNPANDEIWSRFSNNSGMLCYDSE